MQKIELTLEEQLVIENIRLKIQMAELQKHSASQQLASYTQELFRKYKVPEGAQVSLADSHLTVHPAPEASDSQDAGESGAS